MARPRTDLQIVRDWFAEHGYRYPSGWAKTSLSEMVGVLGRENVLRMLADAQRSGVKLSADLVRWIEREAAPSKPHDKPTGSGDADRERFDRGVAATQREIARTRHDA